MIVEDKYNEACKYIENLNFTGAEYILIEILKEDNDNFVVLNKLGVVYAEQGDLNKAEEFFNKALNINENYAPSIVNIGNIYKEKREFEKAEKNYTYAIQINPEYANSYYNLAVLYKSLNNYAAYIKFIKEYKRHIKNARFTKADLNYKGGGNILNFFKLNQKNI